MVNVRINETCRGGAIRFGAVLALLSACLFAAPGTGWSAGDDAPKVSAAARQGIGRLKAAWWMSRGVAQNIYSDFDPNSIPVLYVERREGHEPFALLMGHPAPPKTFRLAEAASDDAPAIYAAPSWPLPAASPAPILVEGKRTAVYVAGETIPDAPQGATATEEIVPRIIHEMIHVYAIEKKGLPADFLPLAPPADRPAPEVLALAVVENRILTEFLFADSGKTPVQEELARQFLAARKARWALMGKAADYERRVDLFEAPAVFVESQILRLGSQKQIEPPPIQETDPSYHAFQYGLLWRFNFLIGKLVLTPITPSQFYARMPVSGGAQAMMLDRLGVDWREKVFKPDASLVGLLEARIPMEPAVQEGALTAARTTYGYDPALAVARGMAALAASK